MTFCLYECLRAVGLQQHYDRFTATGVCRLAQLSELTMEDFSLLGICSMEERTRLIDLVQLIKSFDLDILGSDEDDSYNDKAVAAQDVASYAVVNREFHYGDSGNSDDHVSDDENEASDGLSNIRRRLDFSTDSTGSHQKQSSCPVGFVHDSSTQRNAPAMPVQLHHGKPALCISKGNKFKPDIHSFPPNQHLEETFNPGITGVISMHNSNPKLSSTPVLSKTVKNKTFGPQHRKEISRKQSLCPDMKSTRYECMAKPTPVFKAKRAPSYNYGLPLSVPVTPNKRRVGKPRITVCVRKRPLTSAENRRKEVDVVTTPSGETVIIHESKDAVDLSQYILEHSFYFNHVFGEGSSNEDVYQNTAYPLVQHMLNGGNATCFAYGQTGAGKTHTMLGSPGRPGLYALAVRDIFMHLSTTRTHPSPQVFVSFFEIYCGQLYDLLNHRKRLFARENGQKVVQICGLRHVRVDSVNSLLEVISHGTETRTQGSSGVNPCSSRSHALLQIQLRNSNQQIAGRMWFVDLAGSERASDTKEPDKQSRMEGAEINQSLLALKECIRALDRELSHTPFRQSKLTQVLKTAFVGDSMTCMIANISPGHGATEHTLNTLRYADRVKELKGQGGLRERKGSKTVPSPKHNLPNSDSSRGSIGPRGKSVLEKPNFERQTADFSSNPHTTTLHQRDTILSSKPKNSRCGKEANVIHSKEIGLQHITPIRMLLDVGEKSNRTSGCGGEKSRRIENRRSSSQSVLDQSFREGPMLGQQIDNQLDLWVKEKAAHQDHLSFTKRQLEVDHSEKVNRQFTVKKGSVEDRKWMELRRQVKSIRDTNSRAEKEPERAFQDVDTSYEVRKMHLRRYHEELQKFKPSSFHLEPPSTQTSLSSSVSKSFTRHSSSLSVSTNRCSGMEEYLDTYAARGWAREANRGQLQEVHSQNAAAERPLSPAREQTGTFQTSGKFTDIWPEFSNADCHADAVFLPLQKSSEAAPSNRHSENKPCFVTNANTLNKRSKTPTHTKEPETTVLPQNDAADSFSCIMDPVGISLLQVDRQPATTSYLRGDNINGSLSWFEDESGEDRMREMGENCPTYNEMVGKHAQCEDEDFPQSFLELPQIKHCIPSTSDSREATTQTEPCEIFRLDKSKPLKVSQDFLQDQEGCQKPQIAPTLGSKDPAFPHKHFTCISLQTPIMEPAVQHFVDPSLLTLQARSNAKEMPSESPHNNLKKTMSFTSTPQPENISSQLNFVPSQCHTITSDYDRLSNMSFQPNKTAASLDEEDRCYQNLFTPNNLKHAKWCVVEAYWEQMREMEVLCQNGGTLLHQQPDMAFGEYVHKLEEILVKKAQCLHSMRSQLQPYLKLINHNHLQQQQ